MTENSAFDKLHVEHKEKADLSTLLEQLNLPPKVVEYVRKNQRKIYIIVAVICVAVVSWSLYGSYAENRVKKSNSALSSALELSETAKIEALEKVTDTFSGTDAALWAKIEIGNYYLQAHEYDKGLSQFIAVKSSVKDSNPLYPLIIFGIAQIEEAEGDIESARASYISMKAFKGYENLAYTGIARTFEMKGENESAIKTLEEYLGTMIGENVNESEKLYINEKINRLR